jgi:hypothetical protein
MVSRESSGGDAMCATSRCAQNDCRSSLWFAGGYLYPYDAQETALLSAIEVANGLNGGSTPRGDALLSSM